MIPSIYIKSRHHLFLSLYSYASESVRDPPNLPLALAYTHMLCNRQQGPIYLCLSASSSEDASQAYFQMTYYYILKEIIKLYKGECECADIGVEDLVQSTVTITSQKCGGCFKWWLLMLPYLATSSHWHDSSSLPSSHNLPTSQQFQAWCLCCPHSLLCFFHFTCSSFIATQTCSLLLSHILYDSQKDGLFDYLSGQ